MTELRSSGRVKDTDNSHGENLAIGEVLAGTWVKNLQFQTVAIQILTDQPSAIDGLCVECRDSVNNKIYCEPITVNANSTTGGNQYELPLTGNEYRVTYINGAVATTTFSLDVTPSRIPAGRHPHPVDYEFNDNQLTDIVRAIVAGKKPNGMYDNVRITADNALYVHPEAHEFPEISVHMTQTGIITDTFAVASLKNDKTITVTNGAQWAVNDRLRILDGPNTEFDILKVISIAGNDLTLDRQLDAEHPIGEDIINVIVNMAVDGSVTNQTFSYAPRVGQKVHIHSIHLTMSSGTEPGLERFGGISALTNGVHFRVKNSALLRDYTYWIPARSNNGLKLSGFSYNLEPKLLATWFVHMSIDLMQDSNSVILLDGDLGQSFDAIVQDSLLGLDTFEIKAGIHEEPQ